MNRPMIPAQARRAINFYRRSANWNERRTVPKPTGFRNFGVHEGWMITRRPTRTKWMVPNTLAGDRGHLAHVVRVVWEAEYGNVRHKLAYAQCGASLSNPNFKREQPATHDECWRCVGTLEHRNVEDQT